MPQKPADAAPEARSGIQVIERMMKLLDVLSYHPDPVSLKQLALETGLHPSTAHRILAAMATSGFAERADPGTYRLGIRLLELGNVVKSRINIRAAAMPLMQRLHQQIGESVNRACARATKSFMSNAPPAAALRCAWCIWSAPGHRCMSPR